MSQPPVAAFISPQLKHLSKSLLAGRAGCLLMMMVWLFGVTGCGVGGYPGAGIVSISASTVTIDSGQSFAVSTVDSGSPGITWTLAGSTCTGAACGTLSASTGQAVTYISPSGLTSQLKLTLTAAVAGTTNLKTVSITVNPDPVISGILPSGTVGLEYNAAFTAAGGTAPLKTWSVASGSLPAGLSLSATSGAVTGTPTAVGASNFTVQITDSSDVPFTATAARTIVVAAAGAALTVVSGNPPAGMVGVVYTTTLAASGGSTPYTWSVIAGGLPPGLALSATTGVISGTPTTQGTTTFTAQVQDAVGAKASAPFSISINPVPSLILSAATLPNGVVGTPYSATIGVTGGTAPYSCVFTAGALPAGLTLTGCVVSGTPTAVGTQALTVKASDASTPTRTGTGPESITISASALTLTLSTLPSGTVGIPYSATIGVAGGTAPYSCTITAGALQSGLTLTGCVVSGTPTVASTVNLTVRATDSSSPTGVTTGPVSLTINPSGSLTLTSPPPATVGTPFSSPIGVSGGIAPYSCVINSGTLPNGLTISNCLISGTPTTPGTTTITVTGTDSSTPTKTVTGPITIVVNPGPLSLTLSTLPNGSVGTPYNATIGVAGGTAPYACTITAGTLQAGLSLSGCVVSGTPTVASTVNLTVMATDASSPAKTTTGPVSLTINPAGTLTLTSPPPATVGTPYTGPIVVGGGTGPYTCVQTAGTLPAGLTLTGCTITGTPTAPGTTTITVTGTDSSNPVKTTTGPVTVTVNPGPLTLTLSSLPNGTVGTPYSSTIGVTGGTGPYACTITAGTLQAGLSLTGCLVSGTPTVAGTANLTVKATDTSNPVQTTTGPVSLKINPAPLTLTLTSLPNGTVGTPYTGTIGVAGGTAPYTCTITAGTLQAGLSLAGCVVSGTPTVASTVNLTVRAIDSSPTVETTTGPVSLTINPAPVTLVLSSPPNGTAGTPYTGTIGVTGGTAPYACTITAGTLQAGLSLTGCVISGTPTTSGTANLTVKATDTSNPVATTTGPVTLTIVPAGATLVIASPPNATVGTPYTGTIGVTGGTGPYGCVVTAGTLQAGLSITGCVISGTPTVAGSVNLTVKVTDSATPTNTTTGPVTVTVLPVPPLTLTGSLPNAILGVPYTQTLHAAGGVAPYTYAVTAGALPAGITMSTTGVISGTPTIVGASSFTVTATDTETTPQTASLPLVLLVVYPTTPNDGLLTGPYAYLFQGYDDTVAGLSAYQTATVGSFTADGTGVIGAGEQDANHQTSNPTGNTISSNTFLGTYTVGADLRGFMTITALNPNGTVAATSTYAIALKPAVAPATNSAQSSMIEYDNNSLQGTKGSGSILAQTPSAFATALGGSFAFGLQGDSPCLPTCTIGIIAGPAASVGQFTTDGAGTITTGTSDLNIASNNLATRALTGGYGTADGNGRLSLTMNTAGTPIGVYPTDYAVYVVNANESFVLSTDKHSAYILLGGSAQRQTQATFSNASMSGPFVGFENSATNPGLVGATLTNTLNLSTATVFRATSDAAGNCNTTNVDVAGTTGVVNSLTGLGSGAPILNALLGTYATTGASTCGTVANGRGVLNYPAPGSILSATLALLGLGGTPPAPRVYYLIAPNHGYFLETGYAGLGNFEPQIGAPFSLATLNGRYIYASAPASSAASANNSGIFTANGTGQATTTQDLNVGVGTLNILELGATATQTYTLTDFTVGRYTFGTSDVIYAINPNRFVLLDENLLSTSPSYSLLY